MKVTTLPVTPQAVLQNVKQTANQQDQFKEVFSKQLGEKKLSELKEKALQAETQEANPQALLQSLAGLMQVDVNNIPLFTPSSVDAQPVEITTELMQTGLPQATASPLIMVNTSNPNPQPQLVMQTQSVSDALRLPTTNPQMQHPIQTFQENGMTQLQPEAIQMLTSRTDVDLTPQQMKQSQNHTQESKQMNHTNPSNSKVQINQQEPTQQHSVSQAQASVKLETAMMQQPKVVQEPVVAEQLQSKQTESEFKQASISSNGLQSGVVDTSNQLIVTISDQANKLDHASATQFANTITAKFEEGKSEFTMELFPQHLGKVSVKLIAENGVLTVELLADNPKTQNLLLGSTGEIKALLQESAQRTTHVIASTQNEAMHQNYTQQESNSKQNQQQNQTTQANTTSNEEVVPGLDFLSVLQELNLKTRFH